MTKTKRSVIEAQHECDVPIVGAFQPLINFFLKRKEQIVFYIFKENTNQEKLCPSSIKEKKYIQEFEAIGYILQTPLVMLYSWKSILICHFIVW